MQDFPLTITAWAAVILGVLYLWLTVRVIGERRHKKIIHGDNDDAAFQKKVRGHANAAEQIPLGLIFLAFVEFLQPEWVVLILAALLVLGRISHGCYFTLVGLNWRFRMFGMLGTLLAQGFSVLAIAAGLLMQG